MKRLSIISGVLFLCTSLMAANKITGKIIDESNNQHIEYANVSLLTQDSTFITGVATDNVRRDCLYIRCGSHLSGGWQLFQLESLLCR